VIRAYNFPESKVRVLYLGIDLHRFDAARVPIVRGQRSRIGYVGRIVNAHKGVDYLPLVARVLLDMGREAIEFVVVGDGPDRSVVETLCEQLNVAHVFSFLGWRADVQDLMSSFDVLVIPSRFESFGLVALEALAMGVMVVGFEVNGLIEAVGRCPAAQLVPPGNVVAMAQAIGATVDALARRSMTGRAYVEEYFSNQRMTLDMQRVYREYAEPA